MLHASFEHLRGCGINLIGGHSLIDQEDLMLGYSVVGKREAGTYQRKILPGDNIVLTKKLGTSVATGLWKAHENFSCQFSDVLDGMKESNSIASNILKRVGVGAVTDVTGYGLLGHLINLLKRYDVAAMLVIDNVPLYESLKSVPYLEQPSSRLFFQNKEFSGKYVKNLDALGSNKENFFIDAQVSGGLLAICSKEQCVELKAKNNIEFSVVGEICAGNSGQVTLI